MGDSKNPAKEIETEAFFGNGDRHAFAYLGTPSPNPWDLTLCRQKGLSAKGHSIPADDPAQPQFPLAGFQVSLFGRIISVP